MIGAWYVEAGKYNVLPVDGRGVARFAEQRPQLSAETSTYRYYRGTGSIPTNAAAVVLNRPHAIVADVEIPAGGAEGILVAHGGNDSGYAFYIKDNRLTWVHNYVGRERHYVVSVEDVPEGRHALRFEFEVTGPPDIANRRGTPGRAQLYFDDRLVGSADVPVTTPLALGLTSGVVVGEAPGSPVTPEYHPPFAFTGTIDSITYDVSGDLIVDDEATMRMLMARQ